jgi:Tol biopolymer transport system component
MMTRLPLTVTAACTLGLCLSLLVGALLPAAGQIVYSAALAGRSDLYLMDVGSRLSHRLTWGEGDSAQPDWSPDGEWLAYTHIQARANSLRLQRVLCGSILTVCDHSPRTLTALEGVSQPDWSPDGRWIAFQRQSADQFGYRLARLPADCWAADPACVPAHLPHSDHTNQLQPAWSPDGRHIAFAADLDESFNTDLYTVPAACFDGCTESIHRVFGGLTNDLYPQWSPDGRRLVFNYTMRSRMRVGVLDTVNRGGAGRIDTGFDWVEMPAWSPQGDRLALVIYRRQQGDLYLFPPDCQGDPRRCLIRLTDDAAVESGPAWRPP